MKTNITPEHPTKEQIKEARQEAGLTQIQAAELALLGNSVRWSEYENGKENMDPARFELFMIKTGQHPEFIRRKAPGRKTNAERKAEEAAEDAMHRRAMSTKDKRAHAAASDILGALHA